MRKTDGELLAAISKKDKTAYTQFFNQYCRLLYVKVVGMTRDTTDAEDILQNFWLKLWNEGGDFISCDKNGSARSYIIQHLRFKTMDYFRQQAREIISVEDINLTEEEMLVYSNIMEEMDLNSLFEEIDELLANNSELARSIFWMRINNYPAKEVAGKLSVKIQTVYNKYSESLALVKEHLKTNHPELTKNISMASNQKDSYALIICFLLSSTNL
ncbi:MAG: RNA polymerase sigma factor [Bacteroidales bacterium]|nr:RNA polymerase sigma factor [Bacteroidales bacterium]